MNRHHHDNLLSSRADDGQSLRRQLALLTDDERRRLFVVVTLLAGADEALADIHVGLASIDIAFYLLREGHTFTMTPAELLPIVQDAIFENECGRSVRLMIEY